MIKTIGVLAHPRRPETIPVAHEIAETITRHNLQAWVSEDGTDSLSQAQVKGSDFVVVIGGDGAMLRAMRFCAPLDIPVFGINMGYLGFLTESTPEKWEKCLGKILKNNYWVEKRFMLTSEIWRNVTCIARENVLNEVVVSRGEVAKTVHLDAYINDEWATYYNADGVVIATATGSTAYALAVGGPILPPELDNMLIVPIAPHISMERPVVLSQGASVKIVISPRTQTDVVVTVDGRSMEKIEAEDEVRVYASEYRASFIRLQGRNYFFRSLMDRMEPRFSPRRPSDKEEASGKRKKN